MEKEIWIHSSECNVKSDHIARFSPDLDLFSNILIWTTAENEMLKYDALS